MGLAIMVAQGHTSSEALRILRSKRWQAAPNDRQLAALLEFERAWTGRTQPLDPRAPDDLPTASSSAPAGG
jgi:hypothetical protein